MSMIEQPLPAHSEQEPPRLALPPPLGAVYNWLDDRLGIDAVIRPIVVHPVPKSVNWFYVLGSATLTAFIFQVITGVFLALVYVPSTRDAYYSLQWIDHRQFFGHLLRGIHYWGASAMLLLIFAHTARVFLTGSYKYPRELNWLLGVGLLFSTILMGFTGQLLVFNQDSYWAIVVGAEQAARTPFIGHWVATLTAGGQVVGASTLTQFFALHVFMIPGLMFLLIGGHLYLVVYQGISEWPVAGEPVDPKTYKQKYHEILKEGVPFFPDAAWKDAFFALIAGAVVIILAIAFGGSALGEPANPTNYVTNPRPFWFLIWYFALLALIPKESEDIVMIWFPAAILLWMLALPFYANKGERAPKMRPWAVGAVGTAVLSVSVLMVLGYQAPWGPVFTASGSLKTVPSNLVSKLTSASARRGAVIFRSEACIACHMVGGVGGIRGPSLDDVSMRYPRWYVVQQILTGGYAAHGTSYQYMPAFGAILNASQTSDVVNFLEDLPKAEPGAGTNFQQPLSHGAAPSGSGLSSASPRGPTHSKRAKSEPPTSHR